MQLLRRLSALLALSLSVLSLGAASANPADGLEEAKRLASTLHYQEGNILLKGGFARLTLPHQLRFLSPEDSKTLLVDIYGNVDSDDRLGTIVPEGFDPLKGGVFIVLSWSDSGYVRDNDAASIDYTKLLESMKKAIHEESEQRADKGGHTVELVEWAEPPHYDATTHKLFWAEHLLFGGTHDTLNYKVRILGRRGVLVMNAVGNMKMLPTFKAATPQLLGMLDFEPGSRYADFKEGSDNVAKYGIAALVAGGIAAKTGLLKLIIAGLLAAKKLIIVAFFALIAFAKKGWAWIRGRQVETVETPGAATSQQHSPPPSS